MIMKTIQLCYYLLILSCFNSLYAQEEVGNGMLFQNFEKGKVIFKSGTVYSAALNYNMMREEMVFLNPDSTILAIANPLEVLVVIIGERRFLPVSAKGDFYEEIQAGKGSFFVQWRAVMLSAGKAAGYGGYSQTNSVSSFSGVQDASGMYIKLNPDEKFRMKTDSIFYLKSGNSYKKIFTAKALGKLFKGHESEIVEYANAQSINFGKIADVARIVEYGYSLIEK